MTMANPYLSGNYAPVASEETVTDLPVTGTVPSTLNGRYLRNGPNPITPPDPATYHWFAGRRDGPRDPTRGWQGPLVSESVGPLGGSGHCAG